MTGASEEPATVRPARRHDPNAYSWSAWPANASANPSPRADRNPGWPTITMPSSAARAASGGYMAPACSIRCRRGFRPGLAQDRGVRVQHGLDGPVSLGVHATWNPRVSNSRTIAVSSRAEVQDARAVRRDRVGAVDGRGAAAHPAVGPDLHRLGGQPPERRPCRPAAAASPPGRARPGRRSADAARRPGRPRRTRRTCRGAVSASQAAVMPSDARCWPARAIEPGPLGGAHPGDVLPQVRSNSANIGPSNTTPSSRPSRSRPKRAARRIGLPVGEPGLPQRRACSARRRAATCGRPRPGGRHGRSRSARVGCRPSREPVLHVPAPGHPRARRRAGAGLAQPRLDRRDVGRGRLAAVGARRQVPDVATWQCASISPGITVAPSSRATARRAAPPPGPASAGPTAAIRPSRTSMARAVPPPGPW